MSGTKNFPETFERMVNDAAGKLDIQDNQEKVRALRMAMFSVVNSVIQSLRAEGESVTTEFVKRLSDSLPKSQA